MESLIIGIAGGSGSGKSTLARGLKERFGNAVTLMNHDDYYKLQEGTTYAERCRVNYDHPDAFDTPLFVSHLRELKAGRGIECPVYDYTVHNRSNETRLVSPAPVIVVDGILILQDPALRALFDLKIFVDTPADVRVLRRIRRDAKERERSLDSVIDQYIRTVKPMYEQYVAPSREHADLIVPNGGENGIVLKVLAAYISCFLAKNGE